MFKNGLDIILTQIMSTIKSSKNVFMNPSGISVEVFRKFIRKIKQNYFADFSSVDQRDISSSSSKIIQKNKKPNKQTLCILFLLYSVHLTRIKMEMVGRSYTLRWPINWPNCTRRNKSNSTLDH